jgi:hypothetical protein
MSGPPSQKKRTFSIGDGTNITAQVTITSGLATGRCYTWMRTVTPPQLQQLIDTKESFTTFISIQKEADMNAVLDRIALILGTKTYEGKSPAKMEGVISLDIRYLTISWCKSVLWQEAFKTNAGGELFIILETVVPHSDSWLLEEEVIPVNPFIAKCFGSPNAGSVRAKGCIFGFTDEVAATKCFDSMYSLLRFASLPEAVAQGWNISEVDLLRSCKYLMLHTTTKCALLKDSKTALERMTDAKGNINLVMERIINGNARGIDFIVSGKLRQNFVTLTYTAVSEKLGESTYIKTINTKSPMFKKTLKLLPMGTKFYIPDMETRNMKRRAEKDEEA